MLNTFCRFMNRGCTNGVIQNKANNRYNLTFKEYFPADEMFKIINSTKMFRTAKFNSGDFLMIDSAKPYCKHFLCFNIFNIKCIPDDIFYVISCDLVYMSNAHGL